MKKVIDLSVGSVKFSLEEDAYFDLKEYLKRFEGTINNADHKEEIMQDVEIRIAEIFIKEQSFQDQVIDKQKVEIAIEHLGDVKESDASYENRNDQQDCYTPGSKKFYRSTDDKIIAGICGGLATYFGIDSTIIRILWLVLVIAFGTGLLAYLVVWIVTRKAKTIGQKLEMQGYAPTPENIRRYTASHR